MSNNSLKFTNLLYLLLQIISYFMIVFENICGVMCTETKLPRLFLAWFVYNFTKMCPSSKYRGVIFLLCMCDKFTKAFRFS